MLPQNPFVAKPQPPDDDGGDWPARREDGQNGSASRPATNRLTVDRYRDFAWLLERYDAQRRFYS